MSFSIGLVDPGREFGAGYVPPRQGVCSPHIRFHCTSHRSIVDVSACENLIEDFILDMTLLGYSASLSSRTGLDQIQDRVLSQDLFYVGVYRSPPYRSNIFNSTRCAVCVIEDMVIARTGPKIKDDERDVHRSSPPPTFLETNFRGAI